ncbi:MAG TPA: septation protein SepH, partial [Mycobacteriales bacterium]|nr:septation protein SepH [Mycobacteriales bacterium]
MRQLRLVGLAEDGASLLMETPTGESFRLPLDERVRAACRGDLTRLGQIEIEMDNPLRPREIQMRVRAGESAEQIAASSGMPLDRVLRFAYAVLQERGRVVAQARGTAARPKATDMLGPLVEERLTSRGTDPATLEWDAWRREDGRWTVRLAWRHGDREHAAHWSLDLARRALQPEDPAAEQLCAAEYHARTITAVTPLAVAARAVEVRAPERGRSEPGHPPEPGHPAEPGHDGATGPTDGGGRSVSQGGRAGAVGPGGGRAGAVGPGGGRVGEVSQGGGAMDRGGERQPRRVVERRPGEPSRRAHRGEAAPAESPAADSRPNFDEIRAGGRRPGSDHRADPGPGPRETQPGRRTDP